MRGGGDEVLADPAQHPIPPDGPGTTVLPVNPLESAAQLTATLARLSTPLLIVWFGHRSLLAAVDDRGLFQIEPFRSLPAIMGAVLAGLGFAANGWLGSLSPWALFDPGGPWHAPLADLRRTLLDPAAVGAFWLGAADIISGAPEAYAGGLIPLGAGTGLVVLFAACAWRGPRALPAILAFLVASAAMGFLWHNFICLFYWTLHWLNFWLFGVLILLVQWRRKEGPAAGYQSS